ncbi:heavy-metal-associated domain-containing protein [Tumebacillus sp. ITR2]|uniref:Heavy-metal-associated domain-containing protein n=1 Tax=Tumebacillus amylolyticus TaxID=2801339 RepID=A0ABS1JC28_9BACL|nr:cation transporter [Tumebacillus amylolyticus]MBL0387589.1 heavy-metal-associated domain-containing protein [Tumebacillus amylolyticus]
MEQFILKVEGMSCGHCKAAVETALMEAGAQKAVVNLEAGTVDVHFDPQKLTIDGVKEAIEEAGYDVV